MIHHQVHNTGPISKWLLFLYWLPFPKRHIKQCKVAAQSLKFDRNCVVSPRFVSSRRVITQNWGKSHLNHPEFGASPILEGGHLPVEWRRSFRGRTDFKSSHYRPCNYDTKSYGMRHMHISSSAFVTVIGDVSNTFFQSIYNKYA